MNAVESRSQERPATTLVVDDEREYASTLAERLEMRGVPCTAVFDGEEALAFLASEPAPVVMLLDLRMPGLDGIEVLRQVRVDHPEIAVIVVTAHGTDADERLVRDLGARDYLHKPVDVNDLAERIKAAAEHVWQTAK